MIQLIRDRAGLVRLSLSERRPGIALVALHIVAAILPSALALSTGWLVASLTVAASGAATVSIAVWPLVTMAVLLIADEIVTSISRAVEQFVAARVDTSVRKRVRQLAFSPPDASHLEDQEFADDAARASDIGDGRVRSPGTAAVGQLRLVFRMIAAIGSAIVVAVYSPVLAAFLLLASLAMRAIIRRQWIHLAAVRDEREPLKRRVQYWTEVAASRETAKEVRLFGLHQWVVKQRTDEALAWAGAIWSTRRTILRQQWITALLALVSSASALLLPGLAAARGQLSLAELAMTLVAAWGVFTISVMGHEAFDIEYGLGAVRALGRLTSRYAKFKPSATPASGSRQGPPALRIVGLTFRYPGNRQPVLERLDLTVAAGEVLALVGTNGAGKTTLIKLIAGLYQPSDGVIAVDGTPLTPERLASWQRRVAVVFQDFNQYPLSAADNIALAAPEFRDDRQGIQAAAERADAADFLSALPKGFDTPLARHQTGGTDLSGGQWQRIALARAIFAASHGKDLLILDEPTAHLDVEAEARFYEQIVASVPDATIVLISHRLSTVRHADRIVFLDQGRVTEEGTHASLLAQEGTYAELFRLQAARFASALEADR